MYTVFIINKIILVLYYLLPQMYHIQIYDVNSNETKDFVKSEFYYPMALTSILDIPQ